MFKIRLLHLIASLFGVRLTYAVRFIEDGAKRLELRGRTAAEFDNFADMLAYWKGMLAGEHLKEKAHGTYYVALESRIDNLVHTGRIGLGSTVQQPQRDLLAPVSGGAQGGPAVSPAKENPHADQAAVAGSGAHGERDAGSEETARSHEPVEKSKVSIPLDKLGERAF